MPSLKYVLPALLILLLFTACDKDDIGVGQNGTFVKYYGSGFGDIGEQVIVLDNGGYAIMGTVETQSQGRDICFIQTDPYGNTIGTIKLYGSIFDDNGYAIRKIDNGYIIVGSKETSNEGKLDILLIQIDDRGEEIFNVSFGSSQNDEAYDILVLDDGSYIITGYSDSIPERKKDMMIAKADNHGVLQWMNLTGFPDDQDEEGYSIVQVDTANYLIAGYTRSRPWGTTNSNIFIVNWTIKGEGFGYASPAVIAVEGNSAALSLNAAGNDEYIVSCNVSLSAEAKDQILLMKIQVEEDKSIETIWSKSLGERSYNEVNRSYIHDGAIYVVGTSSEEFDEEVLHGDVLLIRQELDGSSAYYYYLGDGNSYLGKDIDFTGDGGFVVTGSNFINQNYSIALFKVGPDAKL